MAQRLIVKSDVGAFLLTFGKHQGMTLSALDAQDEGRGYIQWLTKQDPAKPATKAAIAFIAAEASA